MDLSNLDVLLNMARDNRKRIIALACAQDDDALAAVDDARKKGIADAVLVGDEEKIRKVAAHIGVDISGYLLVNEKEEAKAAYRAADLVSRGEADLIMKGNVKTSNLMKAVLAKELGLRTGRLLSHIFITENKKMGRSFGLTDGGVNIAPDLNQKAEILMNAVDLYHRLGVKEPKIAALAAVEVVNPDMPCTLHAAALVEMNLRGQIKGCVVGGPLALDNAVSVKAAEHKGVTGPVAGNADILLVPDIESGNMLGKAMMYLAGGRGAGLVIGAKCPVILTSRIDSSETKLLSIACGAVVSR